MSNHDQDMKDRRQLKVFKRISDGMRVGHIFQDMDDDPGVDPAVIQVVVTEVKDYPENYQDDHVIKEDGTIVHCHETEELLP
jgi:hypothetical protein